MSEDPQCFHCRFWNHVGLDALDPKEPDGETDLGECRRHAPRAGMYSYAEYERRNTFPKYGMPLWPLTCEVDWCGEYQAKVGLA